MGMLKRLALSYVEPTYIRKGAKKVYQKEAMYKRVSDINTTMATGMLLGSVVNIPMDMAGALITRSFFNNPEMAQQAVMYTLQATALFPIVTNLASAMYETIRFGAERFLPSKCKSIDDKVILDLPYGNEISPSI